MWKVFTTLKNLVSKANLKLVAITLLVMVAAFTTFKIKAYFDGKELDTYRRQLAGDLTAKEKQIEQQNKVLGLAQSQLVTQKQLNDQLKNDRDALAAEYDKFKKDHDLIVKSKDETIAQLKAQITGGTSVVINSCTLPKDCVIGYQWQDTYGRFKLQVPNILVQGNESFSNTQYFKILGEIDAQNPKTGYLEARRVTISEVYPVTKDGQTTYNEIPGSVVSVVDSQFVYVNDPTVIKDKFFNPRLVFFGLYDFTGFKGGLGMEVVHYKGFGLNSFTAFDTGDWSKTAQHIGILWSPKMFGTIPMNFGIGPSVGTRFNNLFHSWVVGIDLGFYIND